MTARYVHSRTSSSAGVLFHQDELGLFPVIMRSEGDANWRVILATYSRRRQKVDNDNKPLY